MKVTQVALTTALTTAYYAATTSTSRVSGFSVPTSTTSSFLGRGSCILPSRVSSGASASATTPISRNGGVGGSGVGTMNMLLNNLFGGGGAYAQKIDYNSLDHPGPEIAHMAEDGIVQETSIRDPNLHMATFAGGCFWGIELAYQRVPGVIYTAVGYAQGKEQYPTYNAVCSGMTGHTEAVIVYYDPKQCKYEDLLDAFFNFVDPTIVNGQGNDRGKQYRTGIYYHSEEQQQIAELRIEQEQKKYTRPIASECKPSNPPFWPAEKYHQQYLEKGGRFGMAQDASKGATDKIRCYG